MARDLVCLRSAYHWDLRADDSIFSFDARIATRKHRGGRGRRAAEELPSATSAAQVQTAAAGAGLTAGRDQSF